MTQQDLADKSQINYSSLIKIERGVIKNPSFLTIYNISQATNSSIEDLIQKSKLIQSSANQYKTSKTGINFVYTELEGVVFKVALDPLFFKLAQDSKLSITQIKDLYNSYDSLLSLGQLSLAEINSVLGSRLNLNNFKWQDYYIKFMEYNQDILRTLEWICDNYLTGILTNMNSELVTAVLKTSKLSQFNFPHVISSSDYGVNKPDLEIYNQAQIQAETSGKEILLIDFQKDNLLAAKQCNWHSFLVSDDFISDAPDHIKSILEF